MAINELLGAVAPPTKPVKNGPPEAIPSIEAAIGLRLPRELFEFAEFYGTGKFGTTLTVYNPFSDRYRFEIGKICNLYRMLKKNEGDEFIPYDIYPANPGLYPWAVDVNGHTLWWLTDGEADKWPIVLMTVDASFERLDMSMSTFLAKAFRAEIDCVLWDREWLRENFVGILFEAETDS